MTDTSSRRWLLEEGTRVAILGSDSITVFGADADGAVLVTGSHGAPGAVAYGLAARAGGIVVNDAGGGKEVAGIAGLSWLDRWELPAAAVAHTSARIGDGRDTWDNGLVSAINEAARQRGVRVGASARDAARLMAVAPRRWATTDLPRDDTVPTPTRMVIAPGPPQQLAIDSVAALRDSDAGSIVFTGSHGGAAHGRAIDVPVAAAIFNDAGVGKDDAGISRLPHLDAVGTPGATVDHQSARIGEAVDTYRNGVISHVNASARRVGITVGMPAIDVGPLILEARAR